MNPEQARSIRFKKRLEEQLDLKDKDRLDIDDDEKDTKKILRELEKQYNNEEKAIGKEDYDRMEYFGYVIEPFNMKEDRETGKIHEDGYVEISKKKERDLRDPWLESLEEVEDPRYKAKRIMTNPNPFDGEAEPLGPREMFHLRKELYDILLPGETANHALNRFRPAQAKAQPKHKKNVRKTVKTEENSAQHNMAGANGDTEVKKGEAATEAQGDQTDKDKKFERIVEICNILSGNGYMDVYTDTKETIQKKFMKEEDVLIKRDLEDEGVIEDMNPDHNVVEE